MGRVGGDDLRRVSAALLGSNARRGRLKTRVEDFMDAPGIRWGFQFRDFQFFSCCVCEIADCKYFENYQHKTEPGCGFHEWLDPLMCARSTTIIPGLLKRINAFERTKSDLVTEEFHDHQSCGVNFTKDLKHIKMLAMVILLFVFVLLFK